MFVRASRYKRREENQLDSTECFIALIICSTCFGHLYAQLKLHKPGVLIRPVVNNRTAPSHKVAKKSEWHPKTTSKLGQPLHNKQLCKISSRPNQTYDQQQP